MSDEDGFCEAAAACDHDWSGGVCRECGMGSAVPSPGERAEAERWFREHGKGAARPAAEPETCLHVLDSRRSNRRRVDPDDVRCKPGGASFCTPCLQRFHPRTVSPWAPVQVEDDENGAQA